MHPLEAAVTVSSITSDQEIIAASVLHDVVEDANIQPEEIEEKFGKRVRDLVMAETENKRRHMRPEDSWKIRKEEGIEYLKQTKDTGAKILYLGDKLSNLKSIYRDLKACGDEIWQKFNQKDPMEHKWYYTEISNALSEFKDTYAWKEYNELIKLIFDK
jgi:myo-inositol-1(or 4)-monophosphatase